LTTNKINVLKSIQRLAAEFPNRFGDGTNSECFSKQRSADESKVSILIWEE
jgi:hypothetical protein